jgi:hypothetical protein
MENGCFLLQTAKPSLQGAKRRRNPFFLRVATWIASQSLSSGAHSRDPVARNDGKHNFAFSRRNAPEVCK